MSDNLNKTLENIFLTSNCPDELFDAFQTALENNVSDFELYKILLANPASSLDEIKMYINQLSEKFPKNNYHLYMWGAVVMESLPELPEYLENACSYYQKAAYLDQENTEPYLKLLPNYNYDFRSPVNDTILEIFLAGCQTVKLKSKLFYELSKHYKKLGDIELSKEYLKLAEISTKYEGN